MRRFFLHKIYFYNARELTYKLARFSKNANYPEYLLFIVESIGILVLSEGSITPKKVEIDLQFYEDTTVDLKIVDLVLMDTMVFPAWEFRSDSKKK